jgi:hypothetical protein
MRTNIEVEEYCKAFETWADVAGKAKILSKEEQKVVLQGCNYLRMMFQGFVGFVEIDYLCDELTKWAVREHKGHWSGCSWDKECEHGCSFGAELTGWIP